MPELPEVETIVRKLHQHIVGKTVTQVQVLHPKSLHGDASSLRGQVIQDVSRRAKIIRVQLPRELNILIHLKMTGQLIYTDPTTRIGGGHPTDDWIGALPSSHTRIIARLDDAATLYFNDQRLFGWWKIMDDSQVEAEFARLGLDIIDPRLSAHDLFTAFQRTAMPIKVALMDTRFVSGVGNIYACDALNLAQINPWRPAKSLTKEEVSRLFDASQSVIQLSIELGGATIHDYRDVDGFAGRYQDVVLAYGREGQPCYNCAAPLIKVKLAGRGTYFCESCQN